ncbi:uncharacterized protein SPSK_00339 [Sporothrix schenckii 1099-18]|uniref:Uncharacterized protein n=1 Tax=Sporothrix schenckii 1099-18 TaxID=1397361 RepID=A0A0F2M5G9_SPOSC|nr:uncharacterized protein SPSK_00339 [Sporothrix schenckii 1099-18]KJR84035.1 hypothetical protein SPSK_00339 [Sporothrix schenckii 1099-18]
MAQAPNPATPLWRSSLAKRTRFSGAEVNLSKEGVVEVLLPWVTPFPQTLLRFGANRPNAAGQVQTTSIWPPFRFSCLTLRNNNNPRKSVAARVSQTRTTLCFVPPFVAPVGLALVFLSCPFDCSDIADQPATRRTPLFDFHQRLNSDTLTATSSRIAASICFTTLRVASLSCCISNTSLCSPRFKPRPAND